MSSPLPSLTRPQVAALIASLHDRGVPALAVLYYHPVNLRRLGRFHDDPTPDLGASSIGRHQSFARVFENHGACPSAPP